MDELERAIYETIQPMRRGRARGHDPEESLDAYCERAATAIGKAVRKDADVIVGLTLDELALIERLIGWELTNYDAHRPHVTRDAVSGWEYHRGRVQALANKLEALIPEDEPKPEGNSADRFPH